MLNAAQFANNKTYRNSVVDWVDYPSGDIGGVNYVQFDRPLIAQLAGSNIDDLICAGGMIQEYVTAIDLNCGCPQNIAKRGNYGAYLLPQRDKLCSIVEQLVRQLEVPVSVKIRKLPSDLDTVSLCRDLESCGAAALTVHGRTKEQNKQYVGAADWSIIRKIKEALTIPVIANGGIGCYDDLSKCAETTRVDGVMSSEAILENHIYSRM